MSENIINVTEDGKVTKVILVEGQGEQAKEGQKVSVHYVGTLESDGSKFDSSRDRNEPFKFTIGQGVIKGWSVGVATMKVGEKSRFTIASEYGYGEAGSPPKIPGGATLVFEIELLEILQSFTNKEEALEAANKDCTEAAGYFRSGKFAEAVNVYHKILGYIDEYYGKEVQDMKVKLNNNLATAHCKLGEWGEALHHAEAVLKEKKDDLKALLHKAEAEIELGNIDGAKATIEIGNALPDGRKIMGTLKGKLDAAVAEQRKRENDLFKRMLGK